MSEHPNKPTTDVDPLSSGPGNHSSELLHEAPVDFLPAIPAHLGKLGEQLMQERRKRSREAATSVLTIIEQNEAIERAKIDPVTGLRNRAAFEEELPLLCRRQEDGKIGLFLIDLNGLKRMNDAKGHTEGGDAYLRTVANVVKSSIRTSDDVYRIGGDEFAVVVQGKGLAKAMPVIALRMKFKASQELGEDYYKYHLGLSIGSALKSQELSTSEELIKAADMEEKKDKEHFYQKIEAETGQNLRR